jgi:uncharacterized protein
MTATVLVDTGPLVSMLDTRDEYYRWATDIAAANPPPWYTTEPVITEATYLLRSLPVAIQSILGLLSDNLLMIDFQLDEECDAVRSLMHRYVNVPMSLADASLVRMSELVSDSVVMTLDADFLFYRRNRREQIPVLIPDDLRQQTI